jgi:hypothetical protein
MRQQHDIGLAFATQFVPGQIKQHNFRHCAASINANQALAHLSSRPAGACCIHSLGRERKLQSGLC